MCALTKDEVIAQLQKEARILLHLASKIDRTKLDYRPTPKQRSTSELLRYLVNMGPQLVRAIKSGTFDVEAWQAATAKANAADFDQVLAMIAAHEAEFAGLLASWTEADFRGSIEMFGRSGTRAAWLLELVLNGCAAYRTQLFLYLKACGREEIGTSNLWQGVDAVVPA
jgi:DinB family